jgi:RHS repeat-associated protein
MTHSRFVISHLAVLLLAPTLFSQTQETPTRVTDQNRTGDLPFSAMVGNEIEHVDLATGALQLRIPILNVKGRGLDFDFHLTYDSNFYVLASRVDQFGDTYHQWTIEQGSSGLAPGWTTNSPFWQFTRSTFSCMLQTEAYDSNYIYIDGNRGKHPFAIQKSISGPCAMNDLSGPDVGAQGFLGTQPGISGASGFKSDGTHLPVNFTISEEDSNGNIVGFGVNGLDTLGRALVTQTSSNPLTYSVLDSSGTSRPYTLNFDNTYKINTAFPDEPGSGSGVLKQYNLTFAVLTSVVLPNSQSYVFKYDQPNPDFCYGNIVEIDLPTGAVVTYSWATFQNQDFSYSRKVTDRTVTVNGQQYHWHFAYGGGQTTVTDPLGNQSVYNTQEGTIGSAKFYNGTATGNPVRAYALTYVDDAADPMNDPNIHPDPQTTRYLPGRRLTAITTTLDDGRVSQKQFDYETFTYTFHPYHSPSQYTQNVTFTTSRGNVTETREYDYGAVPTTYGSGTPGALLRRTDKTYQHNANVNYKTYNIVDRVLQSTIYDSTANTCQGVAQPCAQTQYEYDTTTLTPSGGAPQHDATYSTSFLFRGNPSRVKRWRNTDGLFVTTTYNYDDLGNVVSILDPLNNLSSYDYTDAWSGTSCPPPSNSHAYVTTFTNALNQQTKMAYFPCTGLLQAHQDQNDINAGRLGTTYTYDLFGRTTQKSLSDGGQVANSYNDVPPVSVNTTTKVTSSLNLASVGIQDGLGRIIQTQLTSDPDGMTEVDTTLDALGRISSQSNPHRSTSSSTDGTTTNYYDALGRVCLVVPPDGTQPTGSTCPTTRPTGDTSSTFSGNCTTVTDEAGKSRKSCSDGLGRLTQVFEDPGTLNYETDYGYDALGNLLNVNQKGGDPNSANWRTRTFTYNSLSQLLSANNPESGTITYGYDDDGNLHTKTSPAPNQTNPGVTQTISYCYDQLNRMTGKAYSLQSCPLTTPAASYFYDQTSYNGLTIANGVGRRTGMSDAAGAEAWNYDSLGRVLRDRRTTNSKTLNTDFTYNLDGSIATEIYPSGRTITYTPGAAGRPLEAKDIANSINYVTAATYAPHGALYQFTNGGSISGAITYNSRLQPLQLYFTPGTISPTTLTQLQSSACPTTVATIMSRSYNFGLGTNDNGNVQNITNCRNSNRTQNFAYDNLNRISQAYTTGTNWGEDFTIDPWGNLTNRSLHSGKTNFEPLNAAPATNNKLTGFGYDAAGNMTSNGTAMYTYDAENRLLTAGGATYTYDGDGNRLKKSTGTLYWGAGPLAESDLAASTTSWKEYVFFGGKRVAKRTASNSTVHYFFSDHLGSSSVVTNSTGATLEEDMDYYPYGGTALGTSSDHYLFNGKERDTESGLDYFEARQYTSTLGRFMQPDWAEIPESVPYANFEIPQTLNLYGYVHNNPTTLGDPDGHVDPVTDIDIAEEIASYIATHPEEVKAVGAGASASRWGLLAGPALYLGAMLHPARVGQSDAEEIAEKARLHQAQMSRGPESPQDEFHGMSNEQVEKVAKNDADPARRRRAQKELKIRGQRNKAKRDKKPRKPQQKSKECDNQGCDDKTPQTGADKDSGKDDKKEKGN